MDQFSHDLTLALEETSLMDRAIGVGRWGPRRRTRSTGNLPCAPQPTEDSSSSPTDLTAQGTLHSQHGHHNHREHQNTSANVDGLETHNLQLPASDSDEKPEAMLPLRLPVKGQGRVGTLESDSLNETTFSPARFFKPNARRKRKMKRVSMELECSKEAPPHSFSESPLQPGVLGNASGTGSARKRGLKVDCYRPHFFFCGKRKRSNRDRYNEHDTEKPCSMHLEEPQGQHLQQKMRPRSYSSTSKPLSGRLMPLNKGLLSKINRISAQGQKCNQKTDNKDMEGQMEDTERMACGKPNNVAGAGEPSSIDEVSSNHNSICMETMVPGADIDAFLLNSPPAAPMQHKKTTVPVSGGHAAATKSHRYRRRHFLHSQSMDCSELYDCSSSSLSSSSDSEAEAGHRRRQDTDREGDDELTDWPGNEFRPGSRYDPKRKLTKKSLLAQIRSDDTIGEDDPLMTGTESGPGGMGESVPPPPKSPALESLQNLLRSEPLESATACSEMETNATVLREVESEMSGESSNPFLSSSKLGQTQCQEVREIRAGCRRINGERPGFSIKSGINERLAKFLQDPDQTHIRLPHFEVYETDSLCNLATLYSLTMVTEQGCTVLTKTG
ncbi:hypothetical protein KR018_007312 [Drosophila ironensis]|nr:hypothetical protein KR018_007312 [Drosophila ironensis]